MFTVYADGKKSVGPVFPRCLYKYIYIYFEIGFLYDDSFKWSCMRDVEGGGGMREESIGTVSLNKVWEGCRKL